MGGFLFVYFAVVVFCLFSCFWFVKWLVGLIQASSFFLFFFFWGGGCLFYFNDFLYHLHYLF